MGFGGGGSGSFVLPNHKHTNVLADGGELEELVSLVDGATMKAWVTAEIAAGKTVFTKETDRLTSIFSTVSATKVPITGLSVVLDASGQALINFYCSFYNTVAGSTIIDVYDGTNVIDGGLQGSDAGQEQMVTMGGFMDMNSETIVCRTNKGCGTANIRGTTTTTYYQSAQITVVKIT
jgi:hypothetical protein